MAETVHKIRIHGGSVMHHMREARINPKLAFAEFVDNSLDAHARNIAIEWTSEEISIKDDGDGCAQLERLADIERTGPRGGQGRYGVGAKSAAVQMADFFEATSTREGRIHRMWIDYGQILETGELDLHLPDPIIRTRASSGMQITMSRLTRGYTRCSRGMFLIKDLSRRYFPALTRGVAITFNGQLIEPLTLPKLDHEISFDGTFNGKAYRVHHFGILKDETQARDWGGPGWQISMHGRIIEGANREGLGERSDAKVFGLIELIEEPARGSFWQITTQKNRSEDALELLESLTPRFADIVADAVSRQEDLAISELQHEVEDDLTITSRTPQPQKPMRRRSGVNHGTVIPINSGRKVRHARHGREEGDALTDTNESEGNDPTDGKPIKVAFASLPMDVHCQVDITKHAILVTLNKDYPFFATERGRNKDNICMMAIYEIGIAIGSKKYDEQLVQLHLGLEFPQDRSQVIQFFLKQLAAKSKPLEFRDDEDTSNAVPA